MKIRELENGASFTVCGMPEESYLLVYQTSCRALVRPVGRVHREWTDARTGNLVSFEAPSSAVNMSPGTEIVRSKEE